MEGKAACSGKSWLLSTGAERKYYNDSELILRYSVASPRVNKTSVLETDCISSAKLRPHTDSDGLPERAVEGNEDIGIVMHTTVMNHRSYYYAVKKGYYITCLSSNNRNTTRRSRNAPNLRREILKWK
jgi:hypothetical protein